MAPIREIHLRNFRSFTNAGCRLSPLTLVVGRNNTGKSNFLRAFQSYANYCIEEMAALGAELDEESHYQCRTEKTAQPTSITIHWDEDKVLCASSEDFVFKGDKDSTFRNIPEIYNFDPGMIGGAEPAEIASGVIPQVLPDGKGVTSVLRMLLQGTQAMPPG